MPDSRPSNLIDKLTKLGGAIVSVTAVSYLIGFIIVNMYLNSFGIVNIEIVKARYVTAGILFLIYISLPAILLYELYITLRAKRGEPLAQYSWNFLRKSIWNFVILFSVVLALEQITHHFGRVRRVPLLDDPSAVTVLLTEMIQELPRPIRLAYLQLLLISVVSLVMLLVLILIMPGKDEQGKRRSRKELFREILFDVSMDSRAFKTLGKLTIISLGSLIFMTIILLTLGLVGVRPAIDTFLLSRRWQRFLLGSLFIYGIMALALFWRLRRDTLEVHEDDVSRNIIHSAPVGLLYSGALLVSLVMPLYSIGIYPYLPQQIGGGEPVRVKVVTTVPELQQDFFRTTKTVYLIDRTSTGMLFVAIDDEQEFQSVEIPSAVITQVEYLPYEGD